MAGSKPFFLMRAKKQFGQNFLINDDIITKISDSVLASSNDLILEIGPGKGALTEKLLKKGAKVVSFEIDKDLKKYLDRLNNLEVIYEDFLRVDINKVLENYHYDKLFIVGNLPYYITTPIIKRIIDLNIKCESITIMIQKEVAERYCAKESSKAYGSMTLYLKYYFNSRILFEVSNKCFYPVPNVTSSVIEMTYHGLNKNVNEEKYFKLIHDSFQFKRKTLRNNLKDYNYKLIEEILKKYNYKETVRAEEITEDCFLEIAKILNKTQT